jgi:glucose-6-phosphate isomerase
MIEFDYNIKGFASEDALKDEIERVRSFVQRAQDDDFGGWVDLPVKYDKDEFARIKQAAERINLNSEFLVCIGIGGSYLGHRAVISVLGNHSRTKILYAGNSLSPYEIEKVLEEIGEANFSINVISKSGTTTEPAVAFRIFKEKLIEKYGEAEAARRIYATTDANRGALHDEAVEKGYEMFVVPDNIGGRYSVLSAVGLLPILVAGIDIDKLMDGAEEERAALISDGGAAAEYAGLRNVLLRNGFDIEVLANFEPSFMYFNEWWKQLFGESEGKEQ